MPLPSSIVERSSHLVIIIICTGVRGDGYLGYVSNKFSKHAEAAAIYNIRDKKLLRLLKLCTLYLLRIDGEGEIVPAECCDSCKRLIDRSGIKRVKTSKV